MIQRPRTRARLLEGFQAETGRSGGILSRSPTIARDGVYGRAISIGAIVAGVLAAVVVGRLAASQLGTTALVAAVSLVPIWISYRRPLVGVLAILALIASIVSYSVLPSAAIGGGSTRLPEVLMLAALAGTFRRTPYSQWPRPVRAFFIVTIAFFLVALIPTLHASGGVSPYAPDAIRAYRPFLFLLVAVVVAVEARAEQRGRFLNWCLAIAGAAAAFSVGAAAISQLADLSNTLTGGNAALIQDPIAATTQGGLSRIRIPGLALMYVIFLPCAALIAFGPRRGRSLRIAALVIMAGAVFVSLNRNMYVGLALGLLVTLIGAGRLARARMIGVTMRGVVVLLVAAIALGSTSAASQVLGRASTLLSPNSLSRSGSLQDRAYENRLAIAEIEHGPWLGIGPAQPYGAVLRESGRVIPRQFVQNQYLELSLWFGVIGLAVFLVLPAISTYCAVHAARRTSSPGRAALLWAANGTVIGVLLSAFVAIYLTTAEYLAGLALAMGLQLAVATWPDRGHQSSALALEDRA